MIDWKIIIAIFLAIISLTTGLIQSVFSGDIVDRVKGIVDKVGGNGKLPDLFSMPVNRNITVRGDFKADNYSLKLDDVPIENISINFKSQDSEINIGLQTIDTSEVESSRFLIDGFDGKIEINADKSITKISGEADKTLVNGISLQSKDRTPIETEYIKYENLDIKGLDSKELMLENLEGKMTIKDKIIIKIEREPIKLNAYRGELFFNNSNVQFGGYASKILMNGKDIRSTISS